MQRLLTTSEFAEAIGVSESSVRRLGDSGSLRIQRTKGGHRKIPVAEAIRYVRETGTSVQRPDLLGIVSLAGDVPDPETWSERLLAALFNGHYKAVIGLIQAMYVAGISVAQICDGPIRRAMSAIGSTWPSSKRSIFVEHRATGLCVRALCQIRLSLPEIDENAPSAMGGAPPDDPYLLPSLMVSLVVHECGYHEVNLGPNTPLDVLIDSVEDEKPDVAWLAITNPVRSRNYHREIEQLAATVGSYGGTFYIGGQNAATYTGDGAIYCSSMQELGNRLKTRQEIG